MIFLSIFLFCVSIIAGFWIFRLNYEKNKLHKLLEPLDEEKNLLNQQLLLKNQEFVDLNEKVEKFLALFEQNETLWNKKDKEYQNQIYNLIEKHGGEIRAARLDACATQKSVVRGQINEEILPMLPDFPYEMSCCKFMGRPIDYLILPGMNEDKISEIVFLEVKTSKSQLTNRQKQIQNLISEGKVRFETYRLEGKSI